mmetsp:Transcript_888/g.1766  ORF Transcript_888/g.1766 Transcript_888/m.1766 type:complete len:106 (-) Transcript_888:1637-1954(-)
MREGRESTKVREGEKEGKEEEKGKAEMDRKWMRHEKGEKMGGTTTAGVAENARGDGRGVRPDIPAEWGVEKKGGEGRRALHAERSMIQYGTAARMGRGKCLTTGL